MKKGKLIGEFLIDIFHRYYVIFRTLKIFKLVNRLKNVSGKTKKIR